MIFSVFQKNRVLGYSWSTLIWHRCYYWHRSRDALSPVCGIFSSSDSWVLVQMRRCCQYLQSFLHPPVTFKSVAPPSDRAIKYLMRGAAWPEPDNHGGPHQALFSPHQALAAARLDAPIGQGGARFHPAGETIKGPPLGCITLSCLEV
jgi:hypothetical protein